MIDSEVRTIKVQSAWSLHYVALSDRECLCKHDEWIVDMALNHNLTMHHLHRHCVTVRAMFWKYLTIHIHAILQLIKLHHFKLERFKSI